MARVGKLKLKIERLESRIAPSSFASCLQSYDDCDYEPRDCDDKPDDCKDHGKPEKDCKDHDDKHDKDCRVEGNNGVGNCVDPQPPGNPPVNDGPGTGPGNPGNRGLGKR